ncbi:MAG: OsmC family protein [Gemmatimonadaceae bacterium]|nr:OsmC family protein [Gemmatimonadaceae bacterium]
MTHHFETRLTWRGATRSYEQYTRHWTVDISGKPSLFGSADPHFRGDHTRHNPEELFLAALSSCHCLTYLALCARRGVTVLAYEDCAEAAMTTQFDRVVLRPRVTISNAAHSALAAALHDDASQHCFLARSVRCSIAHDVSILVSTGET